ncbi:MAG: quinone-dependent dihydroorotate dehydrogenase [Patescibacteria group bacterium]
MNKYSFYRLGYQLIAKPLFFLVKPEIIHDFFLEFGHLLGKCICAKKFFAFLFSYENKKLEQNVLGIHFRNPVGLSEGYDKDAKLLSILPSIGFGFTQVGTVTINPYEGNPKPWLVRLKKSKAILVNYGLKNIGIEKIAKRLKSYGKIKIPYSISIGKTNSCDTINLDDGIADYKKCFDFAIKSNLADFYTINISCPNTFGGEPFTTPEKLSRLLAVLMTMQSKKPVFLKMPINLPWEQFQTLLDEAVRQKVSGVIIGNLNKDHHDKSLVEILPENAKGGISGLPTKDLSNTLISETYKYYGDKLKIIGVGGIFTAHDAYDKIKRGATLLQIITGLIYQGPQTVGEINEGLVQLLEKDGYNNIGEAVGAYYK